MYAFIDKKKTSSSSGTPIRKKSKKASNPQRRELWNAEDQYFSHFPLSSTFPGSVQPKLTIEKSNDKYEQQADRAADTVMHMPDPWLQMQPMEKEEEKLQMATEAPRVQQMCPRCRGRARQGKPLDCPDCEKKLQMAPIIQRQGNGQTYASPAITSQLSVSKGQGTPLSSEVQHEMTHKMGADFNGVTIHTDATAHKLNRQLGAKAFTYGSSIYFNKGEYNPASDSGKHLLAHELTHVIQQQSGFSQVQRACDGGVWQYEYDGCSVPPNVASMIGAAHKDNPAGGSDMHFALPVGTQDRPCDRHDECYQTCHGNPDAKLMCDWQMYNDMMGVCENSGEREAVKEQCKNYAWIYFNGLQDFATVAFLERQQQVCSCEGGGLSAEEHLSGFQLPLGLSQPLGKNVIINAGAGTFRPPSSTGEKASLAAGARLIWRF